MDKTLNFIERCRLIHNNKYNYEKTNYVKSSEKVCIICPVHGEFFQMPFSHLKGAGCRKCGKEKSREERKYSKEQFIEKANKIHNNKYDYSKLNYTNSISKIIVICKKHGEFYPLANNHLQGSNCPKCRYENNTEILSIKEEEFKKRIKDKKLDNKFLFLSKYENYTKYIKIQCKKCKHIFEKSPKNILIKGSCPKCTGFYKNEIELIEKFNEVHNFKYDYSKIKYIDSNTKLQIICPIHGEFWQIAFNHLNKCECPKCGTLKAIEKNKLKDSCWTYTNWEKAANKSKYFDSFKAYIIRCWDENEEFYKIGKTFTTLKRRFILGHLPYNWEEIKIFTGESREISILENKLKLDNEEYSYLPNKNFAGKQECFYKIIDL